MKTTWFSYIAHDDDIIWCRRFTCNCQVCENAGVQRVHLGNACQNYKSCGPWVLFHMVKDGAAAARIKTWLTEECDSTNTWPTRHHNSCGLEDAPCARGGTEPGDILLKCSYCPGAFHFECVGLAARKRQTGDWACPSCTRAAKTGLETGECVDPTLTSDDTPEVVPTRDLKGRVITLVCETEDDEHPFELGWVQSGEKVTTAVDVENGMSDTVGDLVLSVITYNQETDLCAEMVSGTRSSWIKSERICSTSVAHRLTSRTRRRTTSTEDSPPTHRVAPRRIYITKETYDQLCVDSDR